jgi:hypothetical protein
MIEDRSFLVRPDQTVKVAWVEIDRCRLGSRVRMSPEAVEKKYRQLLCQGDCAHWPPPNGVWDGSVFTIHDGRHEYLAALMSGQDKILVCWLDDI